MHDSACYGYWFIANVFIVDVDEESEYDLLSERFGHGSRSTKSKSPESLKYMRSDRKSSSGYKYIYSFNLFL